MKRADRLYRLMERLKDGSLHRAEDLARELGVSVRTIYRDMDTLAAATTLYQLRHTPQLNS